VCALACFRWFLQKIGTLVKTLKHKIGNSIQRKVGQQIVRLLEQGCLDPFLASIVRPRFIRRTKAGSYIAYLQCVVDTNSKKRRKKNLKIKFLNL
jgi:hypothetical protein